MTLPASMDVAVFKTARRPDTFLFLPEGLPPMSGPMVWRKSLGRLKKYSR